MLKRQILVLPVAAHSSCTRGLSIPVTPVPAQTPVLWKNNWRASSHSRKRHCFIAIKQPYSYLHKIQPPFPKPIPSRFPAFSNVLLMPAYIYFALQNNKAELKPFLLKEKEPLESCCRAQLHGSSKPSARAAKNTMACVKYRLMACSDTSWLQDIYNRHQTFQSALTPI